MYASQMKHHLLKPHGIPHVLCNVLHHINLYTLTVYICMKFPQ